MTRIRQVLAGLMVLMLGAAVALAEADNAWQKEVKIGVKVLESSYSDNWNSGDKGSVVWTGDLSARLERQYSERLNWRSTLRLVYGQTHNQERNAQGNLVWRRPDKTDDLIDLKSVLRRSSARGWGPFAAFGFTSLFEDLTDPAGRSLNFTPMTFKESVGASRLFFDADGHRLFSRLGVALKQNRRRYYLDEPPTMDTQVTTSSEVTAEWITEYQVGALDGRVDWESKLLLSLPVVYSGKSIFEDGFTSTIPMPGDIAGYTTTLDVDWENTFTSHITQVISVKLYVRWIYDKYDNTVKPVVDDTGNLVNETDVRGAVRKAGQFKQTLALGIGYTFN